jgi:phosphoribosylformylglycinamidine synthase
MGQLEAGIDGLAEAARAVGTLPERAPAEPFEDWLARVRATLPPLPFVSGNVSLYNEDDTGRAIPASPIVACVGRVPDVSRTVTPGFKEAGGVLLLVGVPRRGRLGGSLFAERRGRGADPSLARPEEWTERERGELALVLWGIFEGAIVACHDVSGGGVVQTLLEMSFASGAGLGFEVARPAGWDNASWFSEEPGFVLEVAPESLADLRAAIRSAGARTLELGRVSAAGALLLVANGHAVALDRAALERRWADALEEAFEVREEALS